jgi:hypothetical protein
LVMKKCTKSTFLSSAKPFSTRKTNLVKASHQQPTNDLVVSLIVNHEKNLIIDQTYNGASSSSIVLC